MSDDVTRLELEGDDAALDRALRELGPLMRRQEILEAEAPDAVFTSGLRARLVDTTITESGAPDPAFARGLRERLIAGSSQPVVALPGTPPAPEGDAFSPGVAPIPISRPRRYRRATMWIGLAAALVAALAVAIVLNLPRALPLSHVKRAGLIVAGPAPRPSLGDITRGYPECGPNIGCGGGGGGSGVVSPIASTIPFSSSPSALYYGPLHITTTLPMTGVETLPSYQLNAPPSAARVVAMARQVGIKAQLTRIASQDALWLVAADGSGLPGVKSPLHSFAVSAVTGEIIYHDLSHQALNGQARPQDRTRVIAAARVWLALLGRSGMRLKAATPLAGGMTNGWTVELDWPDIDGATTPGATLVVVPNSGWRVSEAQLWPAVARRTFIEARGAGAAFAALRGGHVPLAVTKSITSSLLANGGSATVKQIGVVQVLTADLDGKLYLVPAYRFSGNARLQPMSNQAAPHRNSPIPAIWYALVSAAR